MCSPLIPHSVNAPALDFPGGAGSAKIGLFCAIRSQYITSFFTDFRPCGTRIELGNMRVTRHIFAARDTGMGRSRLCTICNHERRAQIELALVHQVPTRVLAKRFGLSRDALYRHKRNHAPCPCGMQSAGQREARSASVRYEMT